MKHRVVITGIGVVSPLGNDPASLFAALMTGRSGIKQLPLDFSNGIATAAGTVDFDPANWFSKLQLSGVDRVSQFAVASAAMARQDAGLTEMDFDNAGVYVGCGMGGAATLEQAYASHFSDRPRVSPLSVVGSMSNAPAAHIAMRMGVHGPVMTYSVACASSAVAIGEAYRAIARGEIDTALAGGTEALLVPGIIRAWQSMQTLATVDTEQAHSACRPFSSDRSGLVLAEGAAILLLERAELALARGARIYAEIAGYGMSCDATHLAKPDATGQVRALRTALREADLRPGDVGYVNAHGTATKVGDVVECAALVEVWGSDIASLRVSSTKALHGHLLGAAGALEAAATVLSLHHQQLPPAMHYTPQDPACAVTLASKDEHINNPLGAAISNSFAFGGTNTVLAFKRVA